MKKFFAMAAIALFTITSCSDDDSGTANNNNTTGNVLLKKTVTTDVDGTVTSVYSYDGNKLTGIANSDGTSEVITYTGDLITEWKMYDGTTLDGKSTYEYNNAGHLVKETEIFQGTQYIYNYTHNGDGTISYSMTESSLPGTQTGKYYADRMVIYGGPTGGNWYYNTFDTKNNPRKNITGFNKIFFTFNGDGLNPNNNVTSVKRYGDNDVYINTLYSTVFTYNNSDYPATSVETDHDSNTTSNVQYFYE